MNWILLLMEFARLEGHPEYSVKKMSIEQLLRVVEGGKP